MLAYFLNKQIHLEEMQEIHLKCVLCVNNRVSCYFEG